MTGREGLRRAHRVFWVLFVMTTVSATWLWDQISGETVVAGRLMPALNGLAVAIATVGVLLMARIVWRLSGRGARGSDRERHR